jgi:hypothetical protein
MDGLGFTIAKDLSGGLPLVARLAAANTVYSDAQLKSNETNTLLDRACKTNRERPIL